jgi:CubicO group peptidase (beta-lactamase class C family)
MRDMSRRNFGRLATQVGVLGVTGCAVACGSPSPPEHTLPTETATPNPDARVRPIKLTQADLDRIIGDQANMLLDNLRAKTNQPGRNYGVAVAFAYPNQQFNPYYMYGTVADQTPPTERTIFAIGSITKTFTAALFANGVFARPDCFDWDAGVSRYLGGYLGGGNLSPTMQQITPRMLAQQTSGLARNTTGDDDGVGLFLKSPSAPPPRLVNAWNSHNGPKPGTCWEYSNLGFITLGFTAVSGYGCAAGNPATSSPPQGYSAVLHDNLTQPLTMPDTFTIVPAGAPVAQAYPNDGAPVSAGAASDIKSSAADMHTWLTAHLGAPNETSNLMKGLAATTQPSALAVHLCAKPGEPGPAHMGLAWQVEPGPPQIIWKDGLTALGGCSCWIGITPAGPNQEPLGIAILANGFWDKNDPQVLADGHGQAMLKQIAAAI